jgi:hypothetical protein
LSLIFYSFFGLISLFLILFAWWARNPQPSASSSSHVGDTNEFERRNMNYLPQIRQSLAKADYEFLSENASSKVLRQVRRERRDVALDYLVALRGDFQSLLRMAQVIAALSPELAAVHEFERLRLTAKFSWQYEMIRWRLLAGLAPVPQLAGLSDLVSSLSVRMEAAMKELGERAAAAAELASSIERRRLDAI